MRLRVLLVGVAVMALALLVTACGGGSVDNSTKSSVVIGIEIRGEAPVGGIRQVTVSRGDALTVSVSGDFDGRVHIHGYDLFIDLSGGSGSTQFDALIPGVFSIEIESTSRQLLKLTVS